MENAAHRCCIYCCWRNILAHIADGVNNESIMAASRKTWNRGRRVLITAKFVVKQKIQKMPWTSQVFSFIETVLVLLGIQLATFPMHITYYSTRSYLGSLALLLMTADKKWGRAGCWKGSTAVPLMLRNEWVLLSSQNEHEMPDIFMTIKPDRLLFHPRLSSDPTQVFGRAAFQ